VRAQDDSGLLQLEEKLNIDFAKVAAGDRLKEYKTPGIKGGGCTWRLDTVSPATTGLHTMRRS
jgi:hypothetical protein